MRSDNAVLAVLLVLIFAGLVAFVMAATAGFFDASNQRSCFAWGICEGQ